jgi:hypothetical protein
VKPLTLEEFTWRCLWIECGRLHDSVGFLYARNKVRKLVRRAKNNQVWEGPFFEKSEWAAMVRGWYAHYLKTGVL